ncbi:MAG TPA: hypothetical protein VK395_23405 [Gemmataceae bacterium]|nr:hypothetical protein [Gemmataceae bacterium]
MASSWDRLPDESAKAFAAFCVYRDFGPRRSLDEASRSYHGTQDSERRSGARASGIIRRWAKRWHWRARAQAWDEEQEQVKASQRTAAVKEMNDRYAKEAQMLQTKAIERLRQLRPDELKPRDLLNYLIESAKLERSTLGEPTDPVLQEHDLPSVKELTDEELATIINRGRGRLLPPSSRGTIPETDGPPQPV